ncbi:MAG: hypothetical protein SOV91_03680 [Eubacteriales bacterium]|nr:hypothetical protein [Eubacteriales bacterium]
MKQWKKVAIVYQICPKSFQDMDGNGIGDSPGILLRVPCLAALRSNPAWFAPSFSALGNDTYDISEDRATAP